MHLNRSHNALMVVLIMVAVVGLIFGLWGVLQVARINNLDYELHKGNFEPDNFPSFDGFPHHGFWPAGIGSFLGFIFFIVCFSGCMMRFIGWFGFWRGPYFDNRHGHYRGGRDYWCEDYDRPARQNNRETKD